MTPAPAVREGAPAQLLPSGGTSGALRRAILDAAGSRPAPFIGIWGSVPSTNEIAKAVALEAGAVRCAGSVFIAESQTHGKGRFGRTWVSPPGGLYLSVLVEPSANSGNAPDPLTLLPLAAGVAVARAVRRVAGVPAELRWPNDLDWDGGKVAGVLAEVGFQRDCPPARGRRIRGQSHAGRASGGRGAGRPGVLSASARRPAPGLAPERRGPDRTGARAVDLPARRS